MTPTAVKYVTVKWGVWTLSLIMIFFWGWFESIVLELFSSIVFSFKSEISKNFIFIIFSEIQKEETIIMTVIWQISPQVSL